MTLLKESTSTNKKILILGGSGYIGSSLGNHLAFQCGFKVDNADLGLFQQKQGIWTYRYNYNQLPASLIQEYDVVINLAAHSSVLACELDPDGSFKNNCLDFFKLVAKLGMHQKFIYASSGSVYGCSGDKLSKETDAFAKSINHYDKQKQIIDQYMEDSLLHWYGLRFGTVCGFSGNPRNELMINSMVRSAITEKRVDVTSSESYRAILGLPDLCRAVEAIIKQDKDGGYYNLASFNMRIHDIGKTVADKFNTNFSSLKSGSNSYSFCLDTTNFCETFNFEFTETVDTISEAAAKNDFSRIRNWHNFPPAYTTA